MNIVKTAISDVLLFEPKVFSDERGFFYESFNQKLFKEATGVTAEFVQDNHSRSKKNVLRGLHLQQEPYAQGKLVRCVQGKVFDVAVDLRPGSASFGQWIGTELSADNKCQLWIPKGFAHGFYVLSESAEVIYKCVGYYVPKAELSLRWDDEDVNIAWPIPATQRPLLSAKDAVALSLQEIIKKQNIT
ncbi:dTDP-4-dehydrorhamnose 3,5-epimerase [Kosakonia cowanii]|uniref:dTDP-4-dehydrorhamnose 3,5-epimerase n=1 Tax=Kosakonia cowanii TaxID=208223 RepID=UPI002DDC95EA|nr:dTDP-4-dehydrorhamnose 3,5-epimerase [Kosakonia cowanii]WRY59162.1 dTDP-4-dehydrorhamnose 3,5-epimerase [Kosakonia cowanii]